MTWDLTGEIHQLSPLKSKGDTVAFAFGINDRGQTVGTSGICSTVGLPPTYLNGQHAVLWEKDGTPRYLGMLGDANNTLFNIASSINELGEVVGTSQFTDGTAHSFLWTRATVALQPTVVGNLKGNGGKHFASPTALGVPTIGTIAVPQVW